MSRGGRGQRHWGPQALRQENSPVPTSFDTPNKRSTSVLILGETQASSLVCGLWPQCSHCRSLTASCAVWVQVLPGKPRGPVREHVRTSQVPANRWLTAVCGRGQGGGAAWSCLQLPLLTGP